MSPSGLTVYKDVWLVPAPEAPVERVPAVVADMRFCICRRLKRDERVGSGVLTIIDSLSSGLTLTSRGVSALTVSPAVAS